MQRKRQNAFYKTNINENNEENKINNINNYKNESEKEKNLNKNNDNQKNNITESEDYQPTSSTNTSLYILNLLNYTSTWEKEGEALLNQNDSISCPEDIKLIKNLLFHYDFVPSKIRPEFYFVASGAKRELKNNPNYYKTILNSYPNYIPSKFLNVIEADIERTFPNDKFFQDEKNKTMLKNILICYSRRNSKIGYVQGFNFIVGKILMIMKNEEKTFWIFVQIIENILQNEYYYDMFGMMIDCVVISKVLENRNVDLMNYLTTKNIDISLKNLLFRWMTTLFVQSTPTEIFFTIWDCMFIEGNTTFLKAAYNIIVQLKDIILKKENMEELNNFFEELEKCSKINKDKLKKAILNESEFFNDKTLNEIRKTNIQNEIKKHLKNNNNNNSNNEINCDQNWPFCLNEKKINKNEIVQEILILKIQPKINIIKDYFNGDVAIKKINNKKSSNTKINDYDYLLIQRNKHYCENNNKVNFEGSNSQESVDGSSLSDKLSSQYVNSVQNKKNNYDDIYKNLKNENEEIVELLIKEMDSNETKKDSK
jgi:hypothetical protein